MQVVEDLIINRLLQLAPFDDTEQARRAFTVTVSALRDLLTDDEANWLSEELGPLPLRRRRQRVEAPSPDALYRRVALYAGTRPSVAREHAQVVCRALAESVPGAAHRLQKTLPPLAELFTPTEPAPFPVIPQPLRGHPGRDHTLAGGRPGSTRLLHDATARDADGPATRREGRAVGHGRASNVGTQPKRRTATAPPTIYVKRRKIEPASAGASAATSSNLPLLRSLRPIRQVADSQSPSSPTTWAPTTTLNEADGAEHGEHDARAFRRTIMTEVTVCRELLTHVDALARAHQSRSAIRVVVGLGVLSGLDARRFYRAFRLARCNTVAQRATLTIEELAPQMCCGECGAEALGAASSEQCPACGNSRMLLLNADELQLLSVELECA